MEGEHEVTLADGTKHIARPGVELPRRSRWPIARRSGAQRDHRSRPAAHRGVLHGVGHASRGPDLRQRRHSPEPGARPDRQLRADGSRSAATSSTSLGQLRRPGRQPRPFPHAGRRAGHGRSRHQHAPGGEVDAEGHGGARRRAHVPADVSGRQAGRSNEHARIAARCLGNMVGADKLPAFWPYYNEWADATCIWKACLRRGRPVPAEGRHQRVRLVHEHVERERWPGRRSRSWTSGWTSTCSITPAPRWPTSSCRASTGSRSTTSACPRALRAASGSRSAAIEPPADTKFDYDINRLIFEAIEKQGNPNGTWTNIAGDAPGAYHHDDRLEDWFQAHNEVSGFGDRYPRAASGSIGRTSATTSRRTAGSTPR